MSLKGLFQLGKRLLKGKKESAPPTTGQQQKLLTYEGKGSQETGLELAKKELIRKGCREVWVYLSYAIGMKEPLQMTCMDDVGNTWDIPSNYPVYPNEIIDFLELKKPIYYKTSEWGAYGNGFKWDK